MYAPILEFRSDDPLQGCYTDRDGNMYSVARIVDAAKGLDVFEVPIAALDLSAVIWVDCNIFELAYHAKRVAVADLKHPIILDWNGSIADGRHRIMKAIADGRRTIKAVRITWKLVPDRKAE